MTKTITLLILSAMLLCACTNTREGFTKDADDFGNKVQRTSTIWTGEQ